MAIAKRIAPRKITNRPAKARARPAAKKALTKKKGHTLARTSADQKRAKKRAPTRFATTRPQLATATSKVRNWQAPWGESSTAYMTEFLGRLWALFGAPNHPVTEGFGWVLRDEELALVVTAYHGPTGPAFGARTSDGKTLQSIAALEALVNEAEPADCKVRFYDEYSGRDITIGIDGGRHFLF